MKKQFSAVLLQPVSYYSVILILVLGIFSGCRTGPAETDEARELSPHNDPAALSEPKPGDVQKAVNTYEKLLEKQAFAMESARNAENAQQRPVKDPAVCCEPNDSDRDRGLVVYQPELKAPFKGEKPSPGDVKRAVTLNAGGGETESVLLAAWALKPHTKLSWKIGARDAALDKVTIEILPVIMAPVRRGRSAYDIQALWVADRPAPVDLAEGARIPWLVRVHVPEHTKAGTYSIPLSWSSGDSVWHSGPSINLRVYPFTLVDPQDKDYIFGAFCAGADFNRAQYAQMKAHGIEGIQWFWGQYGMSWKTIKNDNGTLVFDFAPLDRTMRDFKAAGLRGPIVIALGNDSSCHFERVICRAFNRPTQPAGPSNRNRAGKLALVDDPETESLIVEALDRKSVV